MPLQPHPKIAKKEKPCSGVPIVLYRRRAVLEAIP
jgi:hypothetical protein